MSENKKPGTSDWPIQENMRAGLSMLWQSHVYAHDADVDVWDFAIEIESLYEIGVAISELRWLVTKGYVEHGQETSMYGDAHRSFRPGKGLNFTESTCFILTSAGVEYATKVLRQPVADH